MALKPPSKSVSLLTKALAVCTFVLITSGGLVTSFDAGMSVPDWPASFGKWLLIPVYLWSDMAIFLEHNHRLTGAFSGLVAIAALWLVASRFGRKGVTWLAGVVLFLFVVQGVLGGFRVTEVSTFLAIVHGIHGQIVFALTVLLACVCGGWAYRQRVARDEGRNLIAGPGPLIAGVLFMALLLPQLGTGAVTRHTHTASAIPTAPDVYGGFAPPTDQAEIDALFHEYGGDTWSVYEELPAAQMEAVDAHENPELFARTAKRPATPPSVALLHNAYLHRVNAMVLLPTAMVLWLVALGRANPGLASMRGPVIALLVVFLVQVTLGLCTIWSKENPSIATGHQANGALLLAVSVWLLFRTWTLREPVTVDEAVTEPRDATEKPHATNVTLATA